MKVDLSSKGSGCFGYAYNESAEACSICEEKENCQLKMKVIFSGTGTKTKGAHGYGKAIKDSECFGYAFDGSDDSCKKCHVQKACQVRVLRGDYRTEIE